MIAYSRLLLYAVALPCLAPRCAAAETKPSLDTVLAKWEAATAKVKTLDAHVYRWRYDSVFSSQNRDLRPDEGRFYYEGPKAAYLKIESNKPEERSRLEETFIWRDHETLRLNAHSHTWDRLDWPALVLRDTHYPDDILDADIPDGFWSALAMSFYYSLHEPKNVIPLTIDVHASELRKRLDLSLRDQGDRFLITAVPKKSPKGRWYSKIEVIVDAKTYLTTAIRLTTPNGKDQTVWMLDDVNINKRPQDRDKLLSPDLRGLRVHEIG